MVMKNFLYGRRKNSVQNSWESVFSVTRAEKKGCSATEYGLVFGIFELVVFVISPIYGQHLNKIGLKLTFNGGIYTTAKKEIIVYYILRLRSELLFTEKFYILRRSQEYNFRGNVKKCKSLLKTGVVVM
ncbi:hypothetical protein NQ315_003958 [Exocentrus adspersus]|uniref:Uncharacterized protein n=1 Tax=Exocentrus adspersus TaxID=1586481 RepID=A0AAV8V9K7_9CUCU|nr:hypothetical protein NQ315_003958 [Exocentrus adspersus]